MINFITTSLNKLKEIYEEQEDIDILIQLRIKDKSYILLKSELIHIIENNLNSNKINIEEQKKIVRRLKMNAMSSEENKYLHELDDNLENYLLNEIYNTERIRKDNFALYIRHRNNLIYDQIKRFESFSENQNNFDNMISIIKIINRLKFENINLSLKNTKFNTKKDLSNEHKQQLLEDGYKSFGLIKFII